MSLTAPDSEVDICNMALDHLKQGALTSIDPATNIAGQRCARWYPQIRQETLRFHPWNFALKRVQLTPDSTAPSFGFTQRYLLPSDWLRYISRVDDFDNFLGDGTDYEIEERYYLFNGDDDTAINLRYIMDFTNVAKMDPLFRGLFAINLAIILAPNFAGTEGRVSTLLKIQKELEAKATAVDGQERPPRRIQRSKFLDARRGGRRGGIAGPYTRFS